MNRQGISHCVEGGHPGESIQPAGIDQRKEDLPHTSVITATSTKPGYGTASVDADVKMLQLQVTGSSLTQQSLDSVAGAVSCSAPTELARDSVQSVHHAAAGCCTDDTCASF